MNRSTVHAVGPINFRTLSLAAYFFSFAAISGYATYGSTVNVGGRQDGGLFYVWLVGALIGSLLIVAKNQMLGDRSLRMRLYLSDLTLLGAALLVLAILPAGIGLVRPLALLALLGVYYHWYEKLIVARGL